MLPLVGEVTTCLSSAEPPALEATVPFSLLKLLLFSLLNQFLSL